MNTSCLFAALEARPAFSFCCCYFVVSIQPNTMCGLFFFFIATNRTDCQLSTTAMMQIGIISLGRQGGDKANDLAASESTQSKSIN